MALYDDMYDVIASAIDEGKTPENFIALAQEVWDDVLSDRQRWADRAFKQALDGNP